MELRDIEYFAVLAEHGHFGRAAAALGITQPALSKSLRRLETVLEVKLVQRTAKGVELTTEGSALRLRVNELRLSLQSVTREIKEIADGRVGSLRVGVGGAISEDLLSSAFARLRQEAPRTKLDVIVSDNDEMVPALRKGELDLIVNYMPIQAEGLVCEHLCHDDYVVCASVGHRLSGRKRVELRDLLGERWAWAEPSLGAQQKLREHVKMRNHITKNVKYPATKEEIVTTFKGLHDIKPDDRKWFEETLPSKTYESPDDVMKALGWEVAPEGTATAAASGNKPAK